MYNNQRGAESVMDPLKMVHGVKHPLDQQEDKIKQLPGQQKRYYPVD